MSPQSTPQQNLFSELPDPSPPPAQEAGGKNAVSPLKITASAGQKLSPAQQRLNKQLARIRNLSAQIELIERLLQKYQGPHSLVMDQLHAQFAAHQKTMALQLHTQVQTGKWSKAQKRDLSEIVANLLQQTEHLQDPELLSLFDHYFSAQEQAMWTEYEAQSVQQLKEMAQQACGPDELQDLPDDPDAWLAMLMKKMAEEGAANQGQTNTQAHRGSPSTRQQQAQQAQADAKTTLRTLYRQLASALHPDRESDPTERERKTALMSQANAAYERQDLATLLQLQVQTAALDAQSLARMSDEKLASMSTLLKEQVTTLQAELLHSEMRASHALGVHLSAKTPEAVIERQLREQREDMQETLQIMQAELALVQQPEQVKTWLKEQRLLAKQQKAMDRMMGDWL
jgi:hypothetical protein